MSRLADPVLWSAAALAIAVVALALGQRRLRRDLAAESSRREGLEAAQRDSFERTASELASAAKGLLGNVSSVTSTSAQAVSHVRATTETMTQLTHGAMTTAVSAETVIGLALQSERAAADALAAAEQRGEELARLAEDVRGMAERIGGLQVRMRDLSESAAAVGWVAERSQKLAEAAIAEVAGRGEAAASAQVAEELRRHAEDARRAAQQVREALAEVQRAVAEAVGAAEGGSRRAEAGAELVQRTRKTIRDLAGALRESSGAARHIATVAQQQESKFDEVMRAMNDIYLATEKSLASTEQVAREARSLDELATNLRRSVSGPVGSA